jgi:SAM-dependent methyltransferase
LYVYDPLTMRERAFRPALIAEVLADPRPGVVLDLGCGTGTLAGQLAQADPSVQVIGIVDVCGSCRAVVLIENRVQLDHRRGDRPGEIGVRLGGDGGAHGQPTFG